VQVIRARKMGFCFGVRRAYEKVLALAVQADARPLLLSGDLVHNTKVIDRISTLGAKVVPDAAGIRDARAVIRTHGTTKDAFETLHEQNKEVHDATCVIVTDARERALKLLTRHPAVIVIGKKKHPEIIGLVSWLEGRYHVVEEEADLAGLPNYESVGVVAQTTFYPEKFEHYCEALRARYPRVEVEDTICPHTSKNQETSVHTAHIVDVMLVVGDQHSSNSRTLHNEVLAVNPRSYFISSAADIDAAWFHGLNPAAKAAPTAEMLEKGNAPTGFDPRALAVGITAGASTPDWVIDEIEAALREMKLPEARSA
jgi:small subunit ribosomal protein S1